MNLPHNFRTATSIARHFGPYIRHELGRIGVEPSYWCDEEPTWSFDLLGWHWDLTIVDGQVREDEDGFAISLSSCGDKGIVGPGWAPYNYSRRLWTTNANELFDRLELVLSGLFFWREETV